MMGKQQTEDPESGNEIELKIEQILSSEEEEIEEEETPVADVQMRDEINDSNFVSDLQDDSFALNSGDKK